jgi:hypothetical protein
VVVFNGKNHGWQPGMPDLDRFTSWTAWKKKRDSLRHPVAGRLVQHEVKPGYARALADLSGSTYPTGSKWQRELVFLGYKYLVVLDRVTPGAGAKTRWLLHSITPPKINSANRMAVISYKEGRLYCKTLLPENAKLLNMGGPKYKYLHLSRRGQQAEIKDGNGNYYSKYNPLKPKRPDQMLGAGRMDVVPANESAPCVYLHVLYPTDASGGAMPGCSVTKQGANLVVKVGALSHTFKAGQ